MLARECPNLLAEFFEEYATPDFTHELKHFQTFRTAYRLMRTSHTSHTAHTHDSGHAKEIKKSMRVCSPHIGASAVPMDLDLVVSDLEMLVDAWRTRCLHVMGSCHRCHGSCLHIDDQLRMPSGWLWNPSFRRPKK